MNLGKRKTIGNRLNESIKLVASPSVLGWVLAWAAAGILGWMALMLLEVLLSGRGGNITWHVIAMAGKVGFVASCIGTLPVVFANGIHRFLWTRGRVARVFFVLALVGAALPWANEATLFLTSGHAVRRHELVWLIRGSIFVVLDLFLVGVAAWSLFSSHRLIQRVGGSEKTGPRPFLVLFVPGILGLLGIVVAVNRYLDAYFGFAEMLVVPLWIIVTTLVAVPLMRMRRRVVISTIALGVTGALALLGFLGVEKEDKLTLTRGSEVGALTTGLLNLYDPKWKSRINVHGLGGIECTPPTYSKIEAPLPTLPDARNVILISIDALKPEAIDWTDSAGRPVMPHLQRFAERSVRYKNAVTPYPSTAYSMASLVTGLSPSRVMFSKYRPDNVFTQSRHRFDRQFVVFPDVSFFKTPINQGLYFQTADPFRFQKAAVQNRKFISELQAARALGERTLAWIHYYEPHSPYEKPVGKRFGTTLEERYKGELARVDANLGRLIDYLEKDGWLDDTLVILFSDHGESLGTRGYVGHNIYLNRWITDVALMARAPGLTPRKDDSIRSLSDIAPTILHFADLPARDGISGRSLFQPTPLDRFVVGEAFPYRGTRAFNLAGRSLGTVEKLQARIDALQRNSRQYRPRVSYVDNEYRMIVVRDSGAVSLYHRKTDPDETRDLVEERPELVNTFLNKLSDWHIEQSEKIYCDYLDAEPPEIFSIP